MMSSHLAPPTGGIAPSPVGARSCERVSIEVQVDLHSASNFYVGFTENISEGGVFVATAAPFAVGDRLRLSLSLFGEDPVSVLGEVAWVRPEQTASLLPPGMGLRFVDPPEDLVDRVQRWIEDRRKDPLFFEF